MYRFASRGLITPPCGVPQWRFLPARQPTFPVLIPLLNRHLSHFLIRRSTSRSTIRRATHCISSQCGMVSKDTTTHYPSSALSRAGDHHPPAPPVRRTISGGPPTSPHARRLAVRAHFAGRKQVAGPRRLDRLPSHPSCVPHESSAGRLAGGPAAPSRPRRCSPAPHHSMCR